MYLSHPTLYEAHAAVIDVFSVSVAQSKESKVPNDLVEHITHKIILDDSLFHPQGGGQPSDRGALVAANGVVFHVLFVSSANKSGSKTVEHYGHYAFIQSVSGELEVSSEIDRSSAHFDSNALENILPIEGQMENMSIQIPPSDKLEKIVSIETGASVKMSVDIIQRQLNSRLHSAGHSIDAALKRCDGNVFGRLRATKGYHFTDGPYVEYEGELNEIEIRELPHILNIHLSNIIDENIPTVISMVEKAEAPKLLGLTLADLEFYPNLVRIVNVAGLPCACGGTHVTSTKDLLKVTVTKIKKKKKVVKIYYVVQ